MSNITYVLEGKHMQVHNNLSKDGFNSILTLLNWIWGFASKNHEFDIASVVEEDLKFQISVDR